MSSLAIPSVLISSGDRSVPTSPSAENPEVSRVGIPWMDFTQRKKDQKEMHVDNMNNGSDVASPDQVPEPEAPPMAERSERERRPSGGVLKLPGGGSKSRAMSYGEVSVDPLTVQILKRTGTENALQQKLNKDERTDSFKKETSGHSGISTIKRDAHSWAKGDNALLHGNVTRDKKKGVSFLSRLMGKKKNEDDLDSINDERRTEGNDARVFSQPLGFIPQLPPPPKYIKVRAANKAVRDFNHIFLAQELYRQPNYEDTVAQLLPTPSSASLASSLPRHKSGAIWTMKFSQDGRYLATGGQDKVVRIWAVISSEADRSAHEEAEELAGASAVNPENVKLNAPVFKAEPIREYHGHTADVLDLSWSKNNFLLSSSMDKTVRLWHPSQENSLCTFEHGDFVASIKFHPVDDRFFLAGSLDHKLRLWSIPDSAVAYEARVPDIITAVAFTPSGKQCFAGCLNGVCHIFETDKLKLVDKIMVRSTHGRNAKGSKITGIDAIEVPSERDSGTEVKVAISSNDSRIRIYNLSDRTLDVKFKGYQNNCSQIHASFTDDARYVITGSEDRRVYIWPLYLSEQQYNNKSDKRPYEYFEAHGSIVTVAVMAPQKTRILLSHSGDPIYNLCDPPPITLMSLEEQAKQAKPPTPAATPPGTPTPRSSHPRGNIIVTADYTGRIKVFRQDCAATKRADRSETASILSRRLTGVSRRSSVRSWRKSVGANRGSFDLSTSSLKEGVED